jgi:hypothetical protein
MNSKYNIQVFRTPNDLKIYKVLNTGQEGVILDILITELVSIFDIDSVLNKIVTLENLGFKSRVVSRDNFLEYVNNELGKPEAMLLIMNNLRKDNNGDLVIDQNSYLFELGLMYGIWQLCLLSDGEVQLRDDEEMRFWYNDTGIRIIDSGLNRALIINKDKTFFIDSTDPSYKIHTIETTTIIEMLEFLKETIQS